VYVSHRKLTWIELKRTYGLIYNG